MDFGILCGCPMNLGLFFLIILMLEVVVHCCFIFVAINTYMFANNLIFGIYGTKCLRGFGVLINFVRKVSINTINNVKEVVDE